MASVTTSGTSSASIRPDWARLTLSVTHVAERAADALSIVAERSKVVEAIIGDLSIPASDWATAGVTVAEEWQWKNDTNVLVGHRATAAVNVKLTAADAIGVLMSRAASEVGAQIAGPTWHVDRTNPGWATIYAAAALDARTRAAAYAEALDHRLGPVEAISELPLGEATPGAGGGGEMALRSFAAKAMADSMPVNAGEIDLSATVFVRFSLLRGEAALG